MGLASSAALAAAERFERSSGPRLALGVWRRLAESSTSSELRGPATLAALRCAVVTRELGELAQLSRLWETVSGSWASPINVLCKEMARSNMVVPAVELAACEIRRQKSAHGLYLYARCLDVAGDPRAADAFAEAAERGEKEGATAIVRASRVLRARWLAKSADTLGAAIAEAKRVDPQGLSDREKLVLARVLSQDGSRFARSSALGLLDAVVSTSTDVRARRRALLAAARHADEHEGDLTPMELDRLHALLRRPSVEKDVGRAKEVLVVVQRLASAKTEDDFAAALEASVAAMPELAPLHQRARDIVGGRFQPRGVVGEGRSPWRHLLDAAALLRDRAYPAAALALRALATTVESPRDLPGDRIPPQAYNVVELALALDDEEVHAVAGRVASALLDREGLAPPRGWLGLSLLLGGRGMTSLAEVARRRAALAKEAGGKEALALALTRAGWQLAAEGDRSRALAKLTEAKALG